MDENQITPRGAALARQQLRTALRAHTAARVALQRAGNAISTEDQLAFQLDHALARDAVHSTLAAGALSEQLRSRGLHPLLLHSAVPAEAAGRRTIYLRRPDLGRLLSEGSTAQLTALKRAGIEIVLVLADGLSATAVERYALPLLDELLPCLDQSAIGPVPIVINGRVAVGDPIGAVLGARLTLLLIGERPGLSAPDSLGAYLTWNPQPGRTDAERNCISNIRAGGLHPTRAAGRISALIEQARRIAYTGINLKESASAELIG